MKEGTKLMSSSLAMNEEKEKKKKRMPLGKGRKVVAMKKIENKSKLQVCFSKRHRGLFGMAANFSTLCGADIAVIAFSPGGRVFSFGNPSADQVITRFLNHHGRQSPISLLHGHQPVLQNMQETFGEDDDDQEELISFINEAMLQEKMDELRGIISINSTTADDHSHDHLPPLFNPFLASIGDLAMALNPAPAPAPALPFF